MIRAASRSEIEWVCGKLPYTATSQTKGVLNVTEDKIGAAILYDGWTPNAVHVHVYSAGPAFLFSPDYLSEIFTYGFVQCGKGKLFTVTPSSETASLAVSRYLGFTETYRMQDGWAVGVDMVIKEMKRENCRFLRKH